MPQPGHGLGLDPQELHPDQLADFAEVPIYQLEHTGHLPLARRDVTRIKIADLEVGEELLTRRGVVAVRPSGQHWNVERLESL